MGLTESGKKLSRREQDVYSLACDGWSACEIGEELGIAEKTVKFHLANIYRKCEVKNKYELVKTTAAFNHKMVKR